MYVRFVGQGELSFEYNGKRFFFNKNTPPVEISAEIYDHVKAARTVESNWLQPCDPPKAEADPADRIKISELQKENKKLKEKIQELEEREKEKTKDTKKKK